MPRVYLDYAATTPLSLAAREAMRPWQETHFGNPSSLYEEGRKAKAALDAARETISRALGSLFGEIVFVSSGSEAANLAIVGAALANSAAARDRILLGAAEHPCVLRAQPLLERLGYRVEIVAVDAIGRLRLDDLERRLGSDVLLVSGMHANNELGTMQQAKEIAALARGCGALFYCDAAQTFLSFAWTAGDIEADLISVSAHKVGGPKGVAALYVRSGVRIKPLALGGGQERELRAGTENVAGIVGFGAAVIEAQASGLEERSRARRESRDAFLSALDSRAFAATVPDRGGVLPGHAHVRAPGIDAETMLIRLDRQGVSASSGAACSSGSLEPSHVMLACGYSAREAREGLRFTFGHQTSAADARLAAQIVNDAASEILATRR